MRIGLDLPQDFGFESIQGTKAERATVGRERTNSASDEVNFSSDRASLRLLHAELIDVPEIRKDRVEALRRSIANGDYSVSAETIADAMYREFSAL